MSQQFSVDFGRQGKGLPQPFQVGGQKQSLQERLVGAAQLKQARLNESRRRLERAQAIDRQDLQALAGYDAGQLADSFRPLFQQDVEEARRFIIESDDILEQQNVLAQLQSTWNWMSEHNNETVQAARKAMKGVAFSEPNQQRAASAGLDVGLEFDETPQHFAEVEMRFNNFFDPSKAKKMEGTWMIEKDGEYVDIRELEGYGNAEMFTPRTRQVDVGLLSNWATGSDVQRVVTLDGEYSEERAREVFSQALMNNKTGKEHRAQILATLHQRKESPFLSPAQERAFIEGVPMDKDDDMFASAMTQALERGEEIFLSMAKSEPTPNQKDMARGRFVDSGQRVNFTDDAGGEHTGTVRSLDGLGTMTITEESGSSIKATPSSIFVDENNQVFLKYSDMTEGAGDVTPRIIPLEGEDLATIDLRLRTKHNISVSDLLTETKQEEGVNEGLWIESTGVSEDQVQQPVEAQVVEQDSATEVVEAPSSAALTQPLPEGDSFVERQARARARRDARKPVAPVNTQEVVDNMFRPDGVFDQIVELNPMTLANRDLMVDFLSNPEVQSQIQKLNLEGVGSGVGAAGGRRSLLGRGLESAFGALGYETSVTKNAKKIIEWMKSPEGTEAMRKHAMMSSPAGQEETGDPIQKADQQAQESSRVIASLPSDVRDRAVQRINNALPQKLFAYETSNSMGEKAVGFLNEAGEDTGEMIFFN